MMSPKLQLSRHSCVCCQFTEVCCYCGWNSWNLKTVEYLTFQQAVLFSFSNFVDLKVPGSGRCQLLFKTKTFILVSSSSLSWALTSWAISSLSLLSTGKNGASAGVHSTANPLGHMQEDWNTATTSRSKVNKRKPTKKVLSPSFSEESDHPPAPEAKIYYILALERNNEFFTLNKHKLQ